MFETHRYSQLVLRLGLAATFLWFGIGKFIQTQYWTDVWLPAWVLRAAGVVGMSSANVVVLFGIIEVLIAASLVTGFFQRWFAVVGILVLLTAISAHGATEVMARDIGLLGALAALMLWPERRYS